MAQFEPQKLIVVALAIVLLAPLGYVFWRIAGLRSRPEAEIKAELEAKLRERAGGVQTTNQDGTVRMEHVLGMGQTVSVRFFRGGVRWLSFFPRPWVGVLGLIGIGISLLCLIVLLFLPRSTEVSVSELASSPPAAGRDE